MSRSSSKTNWRFFQKTLLGVVLLLICLSISTIFYLSNIDLWWGSVESITKKNFNFALKCDKKTWSNFGILQLQSCGNSDEGLSFSSLTFNILDGSLKITNLSLSHLNASKKQKSLSIPKLPFFLQNLEIKNISMQNLQDKDYLSLISEIDRLILKRKHYFSNDWNSEASLNDKRLTLKGVLGKGMNLTGTFNDFLVQTNELSTSLNGEVLLKAKSSWKKQFQVIFNNLSFSQNKLFKNNKSIEMANIQLVGQFTVNEDFKKIEELKNFSLTSQGLKLKSDNSVENKILIKEFKIKNFQKVFNLFSPEMQIVDLQDGIISGYLQIDKKDFYQSNLFLELKSLQNLQIQANKELVQIPNINASVLIKPFKKKQSKTKKILSNPFVLKHSPEPNTESKRKLNQILQNLCQKIGIQKVLQFKMQIEPYELSKLKGILKSQISDLYLQSGLLKGFVEYDETQKSVLKGKLQISNSTLRSLSQKDFALKKGNGKITLNDEKISIKLNFQNAFSRSPVTEKIFIEGNLNYLPKLAGLIKIQSPLFSHSVSLRKEKIKSLKVVLTDFETKLFVQNNELAKIYSKGKLKKCSFSINDPNHKENIVVFKNGNFLLSYLANGSSNTSANLDVNNLKINFGQSNSTLSAKCKIDKKFQVNPIKILLKGRTNAEDLESIIAILNSKFNKNVQKNSQNEYPINLNGEIAYSINFANSSFRKFDIDLKNFSANYEDANLINQLSGNLHLKNKDLLLSNSSFDIADKSKFKMFAKLHNFVELTNLNKQLNSKDLLENSELRIRALVNPHSLIKNLQGKGFIDGSFSMEIDESIYLPLFIKIYPKKNLIGFDFATNFHKIQVGKSKIHLSQNLSNLEQIYGTGDIDLEKQKLRIHEIHYRGDNFGILAQMEGQKDFASFKIESAPLIDLSELSKIWFTENASGQFRGKIVNKGFNPQIENSWLNNLEVSFHSEENVHDIQYGILYGKHFSFELMTKNGDGNLSLSTKKGKLKNLQITDLISSAKIKDGSILEIQKTSFKAADGKVDLAGQIDLNNWDSKFNGQMKGVNIETMSNNLFNNKGDYNGKGNLTYDFTGNFLELLASKPPTSADGSFSIESGSLNQTETLSKNLHLANLIFGGPLNFRLNTIGNYLNPTGEGNFKFINGQWRFDDKGSNVIHFEEANYAGLNALHLKMNGEWDYEKEYVDFDVYGFLPKKPMILSERQAKIEKSEEEDKQRLLRDLLNRSRHFKFEVRGNPGDSGELTNSVKNSIELGGSSTSNQVIRNFLKE
ncbi:MAG: hypothetical protein QNJ31_08690 [Candidatus Caenarcaniphilales bacterium]|nr:hypothetical protein [Candidatus Caenarcaniphilales bacterium]